MFYLSDNWMFTLSLSVHWYGSLAPSLSRLNIHAASSSGTSWYVKVGQGHERLLPIFKLVKILWTLTVARAREEVIGNFQQLCVGSPELAPGCLNLTRRLNDENPWGINTTGLVWFGIRVSITEAGPDRHFVGKQRTHFPKTCYFEQLRIPMNDLTPG